MGRRTSPRAFRIIFCAAGIWFALMAWSFFQRGVWPGGAIFVLAAIGFVVVALRKKA